MAQEGRGPAARRLRAAAEVLLDLSSQEGDQPPAPRSRRGQLRVAPVHPARYASDRRAAKADLDPILDALTSSELKVAVAVAAGHSNKQVAARLSVSPRTVEIHLTRVYAKLGLRGRADLTRLMLLLLSLIHI